MDSSLNKAQVKVQPRSGFDKSFMSVGSGRCGQLIPILCDEILPNSKVSLKLAMNASLPPLANDIYMRCSIKTEAFFVPSRLLVGGYQAWFAGVGDDADNTPSKLPFFSIEANTNAAAEAILTEMNDPKKLFDWLGIRIGSLTSSTALNGNPLSFSALPFLAYHKIYDDWYRRPIIQRPGFVRPLEGSQIGRFDCKYMPYVYHTQNFSEYLITSLADMRADSLVLNDGQDLFALRHRNFGDDLFTVAQPSPQLGPARVVSTTGNQFTIAALRAQNSMQEFEEFNQLAGSRFQDQLRVRYGASLSDGVAQRALFLGSGSFDIYSKGVYQSAETDVASARNPYNSIGSRYGSAYASGTEFIVSNFTANEPGYLFVIASLVPRRSYGTAISPLMTKYAANVDSAVMGNAVLQNVGNQPIYPAELGIVNSGASIFGYQQRFAEYMYRNDEVHSHLRRSGYLQHFALHETFDPFGEAEISTDFIEIPEDYINTVFAVSPGLTYPHFWFDAYFDYRVSQPLAKFSIPSLQNPAYEHGETITVKRGGISL